MLIGYVSDERYLALCDVAVEFDRDGQTVVTRSTPRGAVHADLQPGMYRVTLVKTGYGSKTVTLRIDAAGTHRPYAFRLLADQLLGYVWPKWAKAGEHGEFRVHCTEAYRLSLWRYGQSPEQVKLLGWFDEHGPKAAMQVLPDGDFTQTGAQWNKQGYASSHHGQRVAAPQRSGLYYFHAETERGDFFAFPWVVAPAKPTAKIAVLASTNSWNAYNNFGGRSNYVNVTGLPAEPVINARQDMPRYHGEALGVWSPKDDAFLPLSFDRPELGNTVPRDVKIDEPIRGRMQCALAPAEWRLLGWLEREAFAYDLYADRHLHDGELDLDAYRVLIISVHPEYWSRDMYQRVKAWVQQRGGRLMYLGGNGINCEVVFSETGEMRCLSHLIGEGGSLSMVDPSDPTRLWDSRFARTCESEASLLGVVTTETGIMTAAPYKVIDASHWCYEGTGLRNGDSFGQASQHERCHGGASGHETDKMSSHSPAGTRLLAKGLNPDAGGAEMTHYEAERGGAVFSVGSINWVTSLWVDEHVSRITANVVRRFLAS
jgi:hypothetical protein